MQITDYVHKLYSQMAVTLSVYVYLPVKWALCLTRLLGDSSFYEALRTSSCDLFLWACPAWRPLATGLVTVLSDLAHSGLCSVPEAQ